MASEWAMEKAFALDNDTRSIDYVDLVAEALDAAHKQGRVEGLEEAAKIAELGRKVNIVGHIIAADIRKRIEGAKE